MKPGKLYVIFKAHAGEAFGGALAYYEASDRDEAWHKFCKEFVLAHSMRKNFKVVRGA